MKNLIVLTLFLLSSAAYGAECRWDLSGNTSVDARLTSVTINGETTLIKGRTARELFADDLRNCGLDQAALEFDRWRSNRRGVNISGGVAAAGLIVPFVGVAIWATPVYAVFAGNRKRDMIEAIRQDAKAVSR